MGLAEAASDLLSDMNFSGVFGKTALQLPTICQVRKKLDLSE